MPARRLRPGCPHIFTLLALMCTVPASVAAQSSATLTATVSETVALSVVPETNMQVVSSGGGNSVRITVPVDDTSDPVIRVPLLLRSNTSFKLSANLESTDVAVSEVSVTDVHVTGTLASPNVVNALEVRQKGQPLLVLTGPRVSLGGTLASPNNALQITVLIHLKPQSAHGPVYLTFVATAGSLTP